MFLFLSFSILSWREIKGKNEHNIQFYIQKERCQELMWNHGEAHCREVYKSFHLNSFLEKINVPYRLVTCIVWIPKRIRSPKNTEPVLLVLNVCVKGYLLQALCKTKEWNWTLSLINKIQSFQDSTKENYNISRVYVLTNSKQQLLLS